MVAIVGKTSEIQIDASRWPVVVSTAAEGALSDEEWQSYLKAYGDLVAERNEPYVAVVDLRHGGALSPKQRKQLTNAMDDHEETRVECLGHALVFSSAFLRGMLTAILWVRQPDYEIKIFAEVDEAVAWGRELVKAHREKTA